MWSYVLSVWHKMFSYKTCDRHIQEQDCINAQSDQACIVWLYSLIKTQCRLQKRELLICQLGCVYVQAVLGLQSVCMSQDIFNQGSAHKRNLKWNFWGNKHGIRSRLLLLSVIFSDILTDALNCIPMHFVLQSCKRMYFIRFRSLQVPCGSEKFN